MLGSFNAGSFNPGITGGGAGFSAEATQFFGRVSDPGTTRKGLYATMIDALVSGGVWSKLDALYMFAAADEATAFTNLKSSSYTVTKTSTPTFTADSGVTGASGKYLSSNFNPTTASSPNYVRDSAHMSYYNYTSGANGHFMGTKDSGGTLLTPNVSGNTVYHNINQSFTDGYGTVTNGGVGFYLATRTTGQNNHLYVNGTDVHTGSFADAAMVNEAITMVHAAGVDWAGKIGYASIGSHLTSGQVTALYNAVHTYLQTVAGIA